jgi:large subunit ribosomal protein L20
MSRVTSSVTSRARKKKVFKRAKGFTTRRKNTLKSAKETIKRALVYSFRDRKARKRDFRSLWITRISIASKENGLRYSQLISGLLKSNIKLNRKILADLAVQDKATFKKLVEIAKKAV